MVYFPSSVVIQLDAVDYSCLQFCAYHNTAKVGSTEFYYGVMPDLSVGGCSVGCGGSAQTFDNLTSVSSHELIESITDAEMGFATNVAAPLAWYDANNGEIGDICNAQQARERIGRAELDGTEAMAEPGQRLQLGAVLGQVGKRCPQSPAGVLQQDVQLP